VRAQIRLDARQSPECLWQVEQARRELHCVTWLMALSSLNSQIMKPASCWRTAKAALVQMETGSTAEMFSSQALPGACKPSAKAEGPIYGAAEGEKLATLLRRKLDGGAMQFAAG
jgi:hypothetical protein